MKQMSKQECKKWVSSENVGRDAADRGWFCFVSKLQVLSLKYLSSQKMFEDKIIGEENSMQKRGSSRVL